MSRPPQVGPKDLVKALIKCGFREDHTTGSHVYLKHPDGRLTSVSIHPGTIPLGTLRAILKQTQIESGEFEKAVMNKYKKEDLAALNEQEFKYAY